MKDEIKIWVGLLLAFIVTSGFFYFFRSACLPLGGMNAFAGQMFLSQSHNPGPAVPAVWNSRRAGCLVAGWWVDFYRADTIEEVCNAYGYWNCFFLLATFLLMVFTLLQDALFPILGIAAGLVVNAAPFWRPYILPWDVPAMFFFTAAFLLYRRQRWVEMIVVIFLGSFFKETILVTALFFLAAPWRWWQRGLVIISLITTWHLLLPANTEPSWLAAALDGRIIHNLNAFVSWPNPLLANAGGLAFLIFFCIRRAGWLIRFVVAAYCVGEFFSGYIDELRVWTEVLPLGWILINDALEKTPVKIPGVEMGDAHLK